MSVRCQAWSGNSAPVGVCLDYLPIKVNDRGLLEAGVDPRRVEIGAASYLQQLVRYGFFMRTPSGQPCGGQ